MGPFRDGWTMAQVEAVIAKADPNELLYIPIVVSMDPPDAAWSESICLSLVGHEDSRVRANAILGFGHLARTTGKLNEGQVRPIIAAALLDTDEGVRGHADSAASDIRHFLGWQFAVLEEE